ncbi:MAG: hypothetical protein ACXABF_11430 [Candidatus Thorarchaeota archaeon]
MLSKKRRSKGKRKLAFVDKICDMSRRGDIDGALELLKGYWIDKKAHPWHRIYNMIETHWTKEGEQRDLAETLLLIRDAVFGSIDIHSLSLSLEIPTSKILEEITSGNSWKDGRRKARTFCGNMVSDLIEKGRIEYLEPTALRRDGFGYVVPSLNVARLKEFKKAQPVENDGRLEIKALSRSVFGKQLLRDQMITTASLPLDSPQAEQITQAYDHRLLDLEIDQTADLAFPAETEQITLNGRPVDEVLLEREDSASRKKGAGVQTPLSEYIEEKDPKKKSKKKKPATKTRKKKPSKKKTKTKRGKSK